MPLRTASASFTRPNDSTAYTAGDLVANSVTAASVTNLQFKFNRNSFVGRLMSLRTAYILVSGAGALTTKTLRLHLFSAAPTYVTGGDNSAMSTVVATGFASWLGSFGVTQLALFADGSVGMGAPSSGGELQIELMGNPDANEELTLYGLLEATGGYTPAAQEVYTVVVGALPVVFGE